LFVFFLRATEFLAYCAQMPQRATLPDLDTLRPESLKALVVRQMRSFFPRTKNFFLKTQLLHEDEQLAWREEEIERLKRQGAPDAVRAQVGEDGLAD
jgi:hypothetical protein